MKYLVLSILVLLLVGCSAKANIPQRVVKDNVLYSTSFPKLKIALNKDYNNIDSIKGSSDTVSRAGVDSEKYNKESYIFVKRDSTNTIQSGVIVEISRAPFGRSWSNDIFGAHNKIYSNRIEVNNQRFDEIVEFLIFSQERYIARVLGSNYGANNDIQIKIYYGEPVKRFNKMAYNDENHGEHNWMNIKTYDQKRKREFDNFLERANRVVRISDITPEDIAKLDTSTKDVNRPTAIESDGVLEELKSLRELYDKDLITENEYDGKRKEILDRL